MGKRGDVVTWALYRCQVGIANREVLNQLSGPHKWAPIDVRRRERAIFSAAPSLTSGTCSEGQWTTPCTLCEFHCFDSTIECGKSMI